MKFIIKYLFFFVLYVSFHYIEGMPPIGGLSFAQIIKIPILIFLSIYIFKKRGSLFAFEKFGYFYSLEVFLSSSFFSNPMSVIIFASKQLPLVLSFNYWLRFYKKRHKNLMTIIVCIAQYINLTSLLTLIGIIEPLNSYMSADSFVDGMNYYSSLYGAPHAASSYFAISIIVLLFAFKSGYFNTTFKKIYNSLLIVIGLYSIFQAFVRTGWLMLIVSIVVMYFQNIRQRPIATMWKLLRIAVLISIGVTYLYNTNDAFRMRIKGENKYYSSVEQVDLEGSGRGKFWVTGIKNWSDNDMYDLFFGKGYDKVLEDNYRENGLKVFSHNQFVDSLSQYGLFSLILLLLYYWYLYKFIKNHSIKNKYKSLSMSIFVSSFIFSFFQNQLFFDFAILMSMCLALLHLEEDRIKEHVPEA